MNIIVHYPKDEQAVKALQKKVADVHAEAVDSYIDKLTCPKEQKIMLLDALIDTVKNTDES